MTSRRGSTSPTGTDHDPFPWVVSLGCVSIGILLFLHSTIPAIAEQQELDRRLQHRAQTAVEAEVSAADLRERRYALADDPEALLVELDRQGYLPDQAVQRLHRAPQAPVDRSSRE